MAYTHAFLLNILSQHAQSFTIPVMFHHITPKRKKNDQLFFQFLLLFIHAILHTLVLLFNCLIKLNRFYKPVYF